MDLFYKIPLAFMSFVFWVGLIVGASLCITDLISLIVILIKKKRKGEYEKSRKQKIDC